MAGILDGKSALVTGGASGIGRATALAMVREGARVAIADQNEAGAVETVAMINAAGGQSIAMAVDVSDEAQIEAMVTRSVAAFGRLDCAFNNAGIVGEMGPVADMGIANWNDVMLVNLTSAFLAAKAQIPVMKKRGQGSIVFTSSFVGFSNGGMPGMGAYAASKAGLIGLVRSLASDQAADGVRINSLLPGGTITPSGGEGNPAALDLIANLHPMKRMANAKEVAQAALFLLSDRSSFMTGSPMIVDGGISVRLT